MAFKQQTINDLKERNTKLQRQSKESEQLNERMRLELIASSNKEQAKLSEQLAQLQKKLDQSKFAVEQYKAALKRTGAPLIKNLQLHEMPSIGLAKTCNKSFRWPSQEIWESLNLQ